MPHLRSAHQAQADRATIGFANTAFFRLEPMQLLPVEAQRHEIQHARVLGLGRPTYGVTRQDKAINAVGIPRMGKLVAGLLETSLVRQRLRLVGRERA